MFVCLLSTSAAFTFVNAFPVTSIHYTEISSPLASSSFTLTQASYSDFTPIVASAVLFNGPVSSCSDSQIIESYGTAMASPTTTPADTTGFCLPYKSTLENESSIRSPSAWRRSINELRKLAWGYGDNTIAVDNEEAGAYTRQTPEQLMSYVRNQSNYREFGTRIDLGSLGALIFTPRLGQKEVPDVAIKSAIKKAELMKVRNEESHYDEGIVFELLVKNGFWRVTWEPYFDKRSPMAAGPHEMRII